MAFLPALSALVVHLADVVDAAFFGLVGWADHVASTGLALFVDPVLGRDAVPISPLLLLDGLVVPAVAAGSTLAVLRAADG